MRITEHNGFTKIEDADFFDIFQTFDCGQTFRFERTDDFTVEGVSHGKLLRLTQKGNEIIINQPLSEFNGTWNHYLALDCNYEQVNSSFMNSQDEVLKAAASYGKGIRILRQDPWETLCSFIISQNNNIPRIKKIIGTLSEKFGEPFEADGRTLYAFPSAQAIANAGVDEIFALKTGFRAKYIVDAAEKVASCEIDLKKVASLPTDQAEKELMKIKGVGPKVASCALLFAFEKTDAFPIDVWVKKVFNKYYPNGFDIKSFGSNAGIAQQYLFYYERWQSITESRGKNDG